MRRLSDHLIEKFGEKIYKLSLSSGCTCPNRDGTLGYVGCTFCSQGGSGELTAGALMSSFTNDMDSLGNMLRRSMPYMVNLAFRDYLNANPEAAKKYEDIKRTLAKELKNERKKYHDGKGVVVDQLQEEALKWWDPKKETLA